MTDAHPTMHVHPHVTRATVIVVFIALMLLMILTVLLSFIPMGGYEKLPAYLIATLKAGLVILFFMEVRHASRLTWVFAGAAFLWLGIMLVLSMSDYATRGYNPSEEVISHREPLIPPPD